MPRPTFPKNLPEFQRQFGTDEACQQYLAACRAQLQVYLDEFAFRHNRRRTPMAAFQTLLGLGTTRAPTPLRRIRGGQDLSKPRDEDA